MIPGRLGWRDVRSDEEDEGVISLSGEVDVGDSSDTYGCVDIAAMDLFEPCDLILALRWSVIDWNVCRMCG